MQNSLRNILVNSTLAFNSAFIFTTIFHETGHYLSYLLLGANPTLFHNYVIISDGSLSVTSRIIAALAGPFFSLLQGVLLGFIVTKAKGDSAHHLFMLWLSLLGFVNFFGYLMMTPFSTMGDTGKVAELLNLSLNARIAIAVLGLCALIWAILTVAKNFGAFIPNQADRASRVKYVYSMMFIPVMLGSALNSIFAFPIVAILSVVYPATSPYVIMISFSAILKFSGDYDTQPVFGDKRIRPLVILALFAVATNHLLTMGIG